MMGPELPPTGPTAEDRLAYRLADAVADATEAAELAMRHTLAPFLAATAGAPGQGKSGRAGLDVRQLAEQPNPHAAELNEKMLAVVTAIIEVGLDRALRTDPRRPAGGQP